MWFGDAGERGDQNGAGSGKATGHGETGTVAIQGVASGRKISLPCSNSDSLKRCVPISTSTMDGYTTLHFWENVDNCIFEKEHILQHVNYI